MIFEDDEIKAAANRLRQSGWMDDQTTERRSTRKRKIAPAPTRFGSLEGAIVAAAKALAKEYDGYSWPTYSEVSGEYGFSFDDAVRALMEAKRLAGEQ